MKYISIEKAIEMAAAEFEKKYGYETLEEGESYLIQFVNCVLAVNNKDGKLVYEFFEGHPEHINAIVRI